MSTPARRPADAATVYLAQRRAITKAVEQLQSVIDQMPMPEDCAVPIKWLDVSRFAHVAAAALVLAESIEG